jgi:hypothetical protein
MEIPRRSLLGGLHPPHRRYRRLLTSHASRPRPPLPLRHRRHHHPRSRNRLHPLSRLGTRKSKNGGPNDRKRASTLAQRMEKKNKSAILEPVTDDKAPISRTSTTNGDAGTMTERQRRQQEFDLMRRIQEEAATKRRWTSLIISGTT